MNEPLSSCLSLWVFNLKKWAFELNVSLDNKQGLPPRVFLGSGTWIESADMADIQ